MSEKTTSRDLISGKKEKTVQTKQLLIQGHLLRWEQYLANHKHKSQSSQVPGMGGYRNNCRNSSVRPNLVCRTYSFGSWGICDLLMVFRI